MDKGGRSYSGAGAESFRLAVWPVATGRSHKIREMKSKLVDYIAWLSVVFALFLVFFVNITPKSFARRIVATYIKGDSPHKGSHTTAPLLEKAPPEGNILLQFKGYDRGNPNAPKGLAAGAYYRNSYLFYPRRVFVADRMTVINNGADIINANFDPDEEWLERNDVRAIAVFEYTPEVGTQFRIEER